MKKGVIGNAKHALTSADLTAQEEIVFPIIMSPRYDFAYYLPKHKSYGPSVPVRAEPKQQRNVPCSCGSGIKTKKCQCKSQ